MNAGTYFNLSAVSAAGWTPFVAANAGCVSPGSAYFYYPAQRFTAQATVLPASFTMPSVFAHSAAPQALQIQGVAMPHEMGFQYDHIGDPYLISSVLILGPLATKARQSMRSLGRKTINAIVNRVPLRFGMRTYKRILEMQEELAKYSAQVEAMIGHAKLIIKEDDPSALDVLLWKEFVCSDYFHELNPVTRGRIIEHRKSFLRELTSMLSDEHIGIRDKYTPDGQICHSAYERVVLSNKWMSDED
ncbi:MAG: hypothetical protein ABH871_04735 [Pseudomonadota bacterium]